MVVFIWEVSNLHASGLVIQSPEFHVPSLKESGWHLRLKIPPVWSEKITMHLINTYFNEDGEDFHLGCEVSIITTEVPQTPSSCLITILNIRPGCEALFDGYPSWSTIARFMKDIYLPKGVLTIQCNIWRLDWIDSWPTEKAPPLKPMYYHAVTRFGVRKFSTDWIMNIRDIEEETIPLQEFILGDANEPVLTVKAYTQRYNNNLGFSFRQCNSKFSNLVVTCRISLLNVDEEVCLAKEYTLDLRLGNNSRFSGFFGLETFYLYATEYVKNNEVKFVLDFTYETGEVYSVMEGISKFPAPLKTERECYVERRNQSALNKSTADACTSTAKESHMHTKALQENLLDLYVSNSLSDVVLEAEGRTFPCHNCILSARSPVFQSLLSESSSCKTDLKATTLGSLLQFLYTGEIGVVMDFQCALELYEAGNKYEVTSLTNVCSDYFENNFSDENVCDVLVLASKWNDVELKQKIDSFILTSSKKDDIIFSSKWEDIVKSYPESTVNILHEVLLLDVMENEELIIFNVERHEPIPYETGKSTGKHNSDFLSIFQSSLFSDFKLCTKSKTFNVHKNILWARSPVFKTMFSSNIKELSLDILDVEEQTMEQWLKFIYSGTLDVPELEELIKLYYLADKYQVLSLKKWCSSSFDQALSLKNACEGLKLVHKYEDLEFKNKVLDFFAKNDENIILSPEWKLFIENDPKLGCEAVRDIYTRKTNVNSINSDSESVVSLQESETNEKPISSESDETVVLQVDFISLLEEKFLSDCTLHVNDKSFEVHKNILCARSPVFKAMFTSNLEEATTSSLDITDIDENTVDLMLRYLYTGTLADSGNLSVDLQSLYYAADKYQIDSLRDWCSILLAERICSCTLCDILELAFRHGDKHIETAAREFIVDNHEEVFNSALWQDFMFIQPKIAAPIMYYIYKECVIGPC